MKSNSIFKNSRGVNYLYPFLIIALLYLLWGLAHGMLDVLNKHFQENFSMTKAQSGFVQFSVYMGYFLMSLPAGAIMRKLGYKRGLISGLILFAFGALLFVPASFVHSPYPFFAALFILACGLCVIENGAHPCATGMGPEEHSERRINIAAAFNGVGWIVGPLLGTVLILDGSGGDFDIAMPYIVVAGIVIVVTIALAFVKLPEQEMEKDQEENAFDIAETNGNLLCNRLFVCALIAQFLYVGAQTGVGCFFINFALEAVPEMSAKTAGLLLSVGCMGMFFIGRLLSSYIMKWIRPTKLLASFGLLGAVCMAVVVLRLGTASFAGLFLSYFFMAPMFPTIFALGIKGMGAQTKKASSLLVMCIVGGAIFPLLMGWLGQTDMAKGFILPLVAFAFIALYGVMCNSRNT
ncbi:MAG: MFS transporter [Bacteroidaceae bacterium]|nr:MFS transporter [Bacteroidaceae bacterium]